MAMILSPKTFQLTATRAVAALSGPVGMLLLASIVAALCGATVHRHGYLTLVTLLSVILVGGLWPWLSVRSMVVLLRFDQPRGREGEACGVELHLRNLSPLPIDAIELVGISGSGGEPMMLSLPPLASRKQRWQFTPLNRGEFPQPGVHVRCGFPFGLWFPTRPVNVEQSMLVWPSRVPVDHLMALPISASTEGDVVLKQPGVDGESIGARHYRRGDAAKLVLRAQTARHDRLIVREVAPTAVPSLRILLDSAASTYDNPALRESAIRFAGSFFEASVTCGRKVDLIVEGRLLKGGGPRAVEQTFDALARITAGGGPDLSDLHHQPLCSPANAAVVVISSAAAIASMSEQTERSRRRVHCVAVESLARAVSNEGVLN